MNHKCSHLALSLLIVGMLACPACAGSNEGNGSDQESNTEASQTVPQETPEEQEARMSFYHIPSSTPYPQELCDVCLGEEVGMYLNSHYQIGIVNYAGEWVATSEQCEALREHFKDSDPEVFEYTFQDVNENSVYVTSVSNATLPQGATTEYKRDVLAKHALMDNPGATNEYIIQPIGDRSYYAIITSSPDSEDKIETIVVDAVDGYPETLIIRVNAKKDADLNNIVSTHFVIRTEIPE